MTDFDVALRLRLAYEPGAARTAVADLGALRTAAEKLNAQTTAVAPARQLAEVGRQAAVARVNVDGLAQSAGAVSAADLVKRAQITAAGPGMYKATLSDGSIAGGSNLDRLKAYVARKEGELAARAGATGVPAGADVAGAGQEARTATIGPEAPEAAAPAVPAKVERAPASDPEAERLRAAIRARRAAGGFATGADFEAFLKGFDQPAAPPPGRPAGTVAHRPAGPSLGTEAERRAVEALGHAADGLGTGTGARRLAEGVAAVTPAAVEARRHVDDVGTAARSAERDLERMGRAAAGGGAGGGEGGGDHGGPGGGRPHGGPGGIRGALIAGARPLHLERLVMSTFTPVGLAGLAGGLGMAELGRQFKAAEDQAMSFETAMVAVKRAVGDLPDDEVKRLEGTILAASRATGTSKEEMAGFAAAALRAGRAVAELPRLLDFGAKAAKVLGVTVDEAGARLVEVRRAWGKDQAGVEDTVDAAALAAQRTGADAASLVDLASRHADMRPFHMSAREVVGLGAGFQGAGLDPSRADAAFSTLSNGLLFPENASEQFKSDLNLNLGINPTAARVGMRSDPTATMVGVLDKLKALPEGTRANVMERMFGPESARDFAQIVNHLDEVKRALGLVEDAAQRNGAVDRFFKVLDDTAAGRIERAGRAFESLAAKIGRRFLPAIGAAADATARYLDRVGAAMDADERATTIQHKRDRGEALTPTEQRDVDANPGVREALGLDPDPAATAARRERERADALKGIEDLGRTARETGDPQIRTMVEERVRDYRSTYPDAPVPRFAGGGRVTGPGGPREDRVPALLSAGEFVVRASEAARHHGLLTAINDGTVPAFAGGGAVGALVPAATRPDDPGAHARLEDTISKGVKAGVVAGLREARDMPGGWAGGAGAGLGVGSEGDGDGTGGGEGGGHASLRYGRRTAPNLRYGRAGGGGFRTTPEARARGRHRDGPGGHHAAGAGASAYRPSGGWTIGAGDGTATTADSGPGFTSGMKARNLGNIGFFPGMKTGVNGLIGPSNSRDVDHSIALYASQEDGIRAAARLALRKYQGGMKNTAELIAGRRGWTPGALGPGASVNIAQAMGLSNQDDLRLDDPGQMRKFLGALARQEHGSAGAFYTPEMIDRALKGGGPVPGEEARAAAPAGTDRRGFANLMHGQYGAPGENLVTVATPGGKKVTVHREAADSFRGFLGDLEKSGYSIDSLGGYAARGMRGNPGRISQHAYGNAIDINPERNPFHTSQTDLPRNVSEMAGKWGLSWGGDWSERSRDPMHFEWTGARPWEHQAGPAATAANKPAAMPFGLTGTALAAMDRARAARAASLGEDRTAAMDAKREREAFAAGARAKPAADPGLRGAYNRSDLLSARFSDPTAKPSRPGSAGAGGGAPGSPQQHVASAAPTIQNFYGMHDPAVTARRAQMERNREVRQAQARALHSVGRVA